MLGKWKMPGWTRRTKVQPVSVPDNVISIDVARRPLMMRQQYAMAIRLAEAMTRSFFEYIQVLLEQLGEDFKIDRAAFFLYEDGNPVLKAKLGEHVESLDEVVELKYDFNKVHKPFLLDPTPGIGYDLYIIVRDGGHLIGVFAFDDTGTSRKFSEDEVTIFNFVAETFNRLIRNKRTIDKLMFKDPLTGLFNKRALEMMHADFHKVESVAMVDVDHFKKINDTYGHEAGDDVLKTLAEFLAKHTRFDDKIFRVGGEEFCVVTLKRVSQEFLQRRLAELSALFAKEKIILRDGQEISNLTFSAGVAWASKHANMKDTLRQADVYLYQAKDEGRNKVVGDN
jgi:diguanylate cyclase (GGDEF)-like protein